MNEYAYAAEWLTSTLSTPAIAGVQTVSEHPLPAGLAYPAITFSLMAEDDLVVVGYERVWAELHFIVAAADQTQSTASLGSIANEIDARLHEASGEVDGAAVISCARLSLFQSSELSDGVSYRRLGGLYALLIQPA